MWDRLLLAIDQSPSGGAALSFAAGLAGSACAGVVVLHVRERQPSLRVPPLETLAEARALVADAVEELGRDGIAARSVIRSGEPHEVASTIASEAAVWSCDAIVIGSTRHRGLRRINGSGVRERLIRRTVLPVLLAPPALQCRNRLPVRRPPDHESVRNR